jgi:calcineurin-like phosphoesterase family protein
MRLKQSAAPLLARVARLVPHLVPHREPNDPIQDQSWDSQIEQKYQAVSHDHADLILSIWPSVDRDSDGTVAYGM